MRAFYLRLLRLLAVLAAVGTPAFAFAQEAASLPALPSDLPVTDALQLLVQSLGGIKGLSVLGIVGVVVQGLMLFLRTPLANFAGKFRLLILAALTVPAGIIALLQAGLPVQLALIHSSVLTAVMVFVHQVVTQFKKAD
jgi:hypothetical protein